MSVVEKGSEVAQLDAILLDHELLNSLIFQFSETFSKYYKKQVVKYSNEIRLVIRSLLFKFTLWDTSNTYGFFLSNLKLLHAGDNSLSKRIKIAYFIIFIFGDYLINKLNDRIFTDDNFSADNGSNIQKFIKQTLINFSKALKLANFINFISFLINGKFNNLKFWLLNINTKIQSIDFDKSFKGMVNYDFQNRQIIWNTLIEFVEFLTPFLRNLKKIQLKRKRNNNKNGQFLDKLQNYNLLSTYLIGKGNQNEDMTSEKAEFQDGQIPVAKYSNLSVSECAICHDNAKEKNIGSTPSDSNTSLVITEQKSQKDNYQEPSDKILHPIISPYITNCGHIYSYLCLLEKLEDYSSSINLSFFQPDSMENEAYYDNGDYWPCIRCNKAVIWCCPYTEQHNDFLLEAYTDESGSDEDVEDDGANDDDDEANDDDDDIIQGRSDEDEYNSFYESADEEREDSSNHQENNDNDSPNNSVSVYNSFSSYETVDHNSEQEKKINDRNDADSSFKRSDDNEIDFGASQLF